MRTCASFSTERPSSNRGAACARSRRAIRRPITFRQTTSPLEALKRVSRTSFCEWKGSAVSLDVISGQVVTPRAAWSYPDPTAPVAVTAYERLEKGYVQGKIVLTFA